MVSVSFEVYICVFVYAVLAVVVVFYFSPAAFKCIDIMLRLLFPFLCNRHHFFSFLNIMIALGSICACRMCVCVFYLDEIFYMKNCLYKAKKKL